MLKQLNLKMEKMLAEKNHHLKSSRMSERRKQGLYLGLAIVVVTFFILMTNLDGDLSGNSIVIAERDIVDLVPFRCVENGPYLYNTSFIICCKKGYRDFVVNNFFLNGELYEEEMTNLILNGLMNYQHSTLLDIGSNLGSYTLAASKLGRPVIAVDPVPEHIGLLKQSLERNFGKNHSVRMVQKFISDKYEIGSAVKISSGNEGAIAMKTQDSEPSEEDGENKSDKSFKQKEMSTNSQSVLFDDILDLVETEVAIVKMDIESYECKAFMSYVTNPKKKKFIPYILMEWVGIKDINRKRLCPRYTDFIEGFYESGYQPYDPTLIDRKDFLDADQLLFNIFWVHKDAVKIRELQHVQKIFMTTKKFQPLS